ncbi:kynureninase [Haladaptatus sp. DYSN1]|uniref:kynureninase n=1 Tax=unclassified Haladaptatus TaxID=2622732 RepID=UPI0024066839|nr:kynureninase [Haladaptatus sp. DYSN1]
MDLSLAAARERDAADGLAHLRARFHTREDEFYMDGNSLGLSSEDADTALTDAVAEWRDLAIRGWTDADPDWFHYGERLGARTAPLVGAAPEAVVVANSTTVNIHTLIGTFLADNPGKIIVNDLDFPTDHYAIKSQLRLRGLDPDDHLVSVESRDGRTIDEADIEAAIDDETAIVFMPSVLYRSGQLLDVERITEAAHDRGALAGFDLAHSVGAVPHELSAWGVDFAVWCSYKYLNAGPGAIAGLYVNSKHFGTTPALAGWWGHDKATQFEMRHEFTSAESAGAWQIGTIPILAAAPLDGSLSIFEETSIEAVREKSLALTDFLVALADAKLTDRGFAIGTPREHARRGGHIALEHAEAYRISLALKERGVVVDFRPPNVVRVCPAPLYSTFEDVWHVVEMLGEIVDDLAYERFKLRQGGVT